MKKIYQEEKLKYINNPKNQTKHELYFEETPTFEILFSHYYENLTKQCFSY